MGQGQTKIIEQTDGQNKTGPMKAEGACYSVVKKATCFAGNTYREDAMSRGPGKVQRAVDTVFEADPTGAFTVEDLALAVFDTESPTRSQRVSVLRAAHAVADRRGWVSSTDGKRGGAIAFYDPCDAHSYALGRIKSDWLHDNRFRTATELDALHRAKLQRGGREHHLIQPGGTWWRHAEQSRALRDGDNERVAELKEENEAALCAVSEALREALLPPPDHLAEIVRLAQKEGSQAVMAYIREVMNVEGVSP